MDPKMRTIKTAYGDLPYKCTNIALAQMQEECGSIDAFYLRMIGREPVLDEDGYERHDGEGHRVLKKKEPDIAVANRFLAAIVQEGMALTGAKRRYSDEEIVRAVDVPPYSRINLLAEEFSRAFSAGDDEKKD